MPIPILCNTVHFFPWGNGPNYVARDVINAVEQLCSRRQGLCLLPHYLFMYSFSFSSPPPSYGGILFYFLLFSLKLLWWRMQPAVRNTTFGGFMTHLSLEYLLGQNEGLGCNKMNHHDKLYCKSCLVNVLMQENAKWNNSFLPSFGLRSHGPENKAFDH